MIPNIPLFFQECLEHFLICLPSTRPFSRLRYYYFRTRLQRCDGMFESMAGISLFSPERISLGKNVGIGKDSTIDAGDGGIIAIGSNCQIGPFVLIRAADHRFDNPDIPICEQGHSPGTIVIEDDCWIAGHVTVTRNVRIGKGSVIGANSVVTRDIPPYSVAAGNPAVIIRSRRPGTGREQ